MTLTDTFLNAIAGVINGESFTAPTHIGYGSTAITIDGTDTSLPGEFGTRDSASGSRTLNETILSAVKTGATVGSAGERLNSMGLFNASSTGDLHSEALVSSLLHTSAFDVEVDWQINTNRRSN